MRSMNYLQYVVFLISLSTRLSGVLSSVEEESDVLVLNTKEFDRLVEKNEDFLVVFYAPWCQHCQHLEPEFAKAAAVMKGRNGISLGKVDATVESELAQRFNVRGYPTVKLMRNKEAIDYTGGRTADGIIQWIEKMSAPAVTIVKHEETKVPVTVVTFLARLRNLESASYKAYESVAAKQRLNARFIAVISEGDADEIHAMRPNEEPVIIGAADLKESELEAFINEEKFPLFGPIDGETYAGYEERGKELLWFAGTKADFEPFGKDIRVAAKQFRNEYSFVWLDTEVFGAYTESGLGISSDNLPGIVLRLKEGGRYIFPKEKAMAGDNIIQFLRDVHDGKVEMFFKSEPIPETNDEPVKVVVGKNFNEMIFHDSKDVLLEIYAPWCGHCKRLDPIFTELAERLANVEHVDIVKMDGTANEPPNNDFTFKGFPSLFWIKAGEKIPVVYENSRTLEGLLDFIRNNSSKPVDVEVAVEPQAPEEVGEEEEDMPSSDEL